MITTRRLAAIGAIAGLAAIGVAAMPGQANAWWRGPGIGISIGLPPIVVAPAPVYVPPPVYYAPPPVAYYPPPAPAHTWVPPHWENGYWVAGHWA